MWREEGEEERRERNETEQMGLAQMFLQIEVHITCGLSAVICHAGISAKMNDLPLAGLALEERI